MGAKVVDRELFIKGAYYTVLGLGERPSVRVVQSMCKQICGKALQTKDIADFLRSAVTGVSLPVTHVSVIENDLVTVGAAIVTEQGLSPEAAAPSTTNHPDLVTLHVLNGTSFSNAKVPCVAVQSEVAQETPPAHAPTRAELDIITSHDATSQKSTSQESSLVVSQASRLDSRSKPKESNLDNRQEYQAPAKKSAKAALLPQMSFADVKPQAVKQQARQIAQQRQAKSNPPDAQWAPHILAMWDGQPGLESVRLNQLNYDQRYTLSRWHAIKYLRDGTADDKYAKVNRARATQYARRLAQFTQAPDGGGSWTIEQYMLLCERLFKLQEGDPIKSPWDLKAALGATA